MFLLFVDLHDVIVGERARLLALQVEPLCAGLHLLRGLGVEPQAVRVEG